MSEYTYNFTFEPTEPKGSRVRGIASRPEEKDGDNVPSLMDTFYESLSSFFSSTDEAKRVLSSKSAEEVDVSTVYDEYEAALSLNPEPVRTLETADDLGELALRSSEEAALYRMEQGITDARGSTGDLITQDIEDRASESAPERPSESSLRPQARGLMASPRPQARPVEEAAPVEETEQVSGLPSNIDFDFIGEQEGYKSSMYVPADTEGKVYDSSGPTIGTGVDIGQRNVAGLNGLPQNLIDKLAPYTGKKGQKALDYVKANPLNLSESEVKTLNKWAKNQETDSLIKLWNRDSDIAWEDLTKGQATAVASVMYQYGSKRVRTPAFWNAATSGDWTAVEEELRNFGDKYSSRRIREANYLSASN